MKTGWAVGLAVAFTFLGAGLLLLITRQPKGEPIKLAPPPSPAPLLVHVNGAVDNPGVYALPVGGRVQDALAAAGGLLPDADAGAINLAAFLEDGQQIWVPTGLDEPDLGQKRGTVPEMPDEDPPESTPDLRYPININTATQSELESLPGIGSVIAQRIIEYRLEFGPFKKIEEIKAVNGIGDAKFDQVKDYITISQTPPSTHHLHKF